MKIKSIKNCKNLKNKKVLLRVDFNVPIKSGKVADDYRIQKSLPTIKYLLKNGVIVIIVSHLGRPDGRDKKLSLKPVVKYLENNLKRKVEFVPDFEKIKKLKSKLVMLENIRFYKDEKKDENNFSKKLASIADIFVLDGFGVAHRSSGSVAGVAKFLPSYAGLLLEEEINGLSKIISKPKKPFVVILGGAKMETKIPVLKNVLPKADYVLPGGGIINICLLAEGYKIGNSLADKNLKNIALKYCKSKKFIMPVDVVVGDMEGKKYRLVKLEKKPHQVCKKGEAILDIGPETTNLYAKYIKKAKTLVLNGAMGYFEQHPYEHGTYAIAGLFSARSKGIAYGVSGGGETVEVLRKLKIIDDVDLVSTGGGAMLEFLSGNKLPGLEALK